MFVAYYMLVKFEQNRMVQTTRNFEFFARGFLTKKNGFFFLYKHFWQRVDAILENVSVAEIIVKC